MSRASAWARTIFATREEFFHNIVLGFAFWSDDFTETHQFGQAVTAALANHEGWPVLAQPCSRAKSPCRTTSGTAGTTWIPTTSRSPWAAREAPDRWSSFALSSRSPLVELVETPLATGFDELNQRNAALIGASRGTAGAYDDQTPPAPTKEFTLTAPPFPPVGFVPAGSPAPRRAVGPIAGVLAAVLLVSGVIVWAGRPPAQTGPVAGFLPSRAGTSLHLDRQGRGSWQVTQGPLGGADGWAELSAPARRLLPTAPNADWWTVDLLQHGQPQPNISIDFEVSQGRVLLRALTSSGRSLVFDPGVPVLSADQPGGNQLGWTGRLARDRDAAVAADARVATASDTPRTGCLQSSVTIGTDTEVFGFCPGAGLVAWASLPAGTGFTEAVAGRPAAIPTGTPAPAALRGEAPRPMVLFRNGSGVYQPQLAPSGSRAIWAGDRLVIADTAGRLTAWLPSPAQRAEPESLYTQRWRSQPGGSIRGLAASGGRIVAGTTEREVVGYDADGWEQWRHPLPDAVSQLTARNGIVLALDAGGLLRALSVTGGETRWESDGVSDLLGVGGDPATITVARDDEVAVLDLGTGEELWSVQAGSSQPQAAPFGDAVAMLTGNWLVVRDRATGAVRWQRAVADDSLLYSLDASLLLSEPRAATVLDPSGAASWRSTEAPVVVPVAASGQLIGVTDAGLLLAGPGAPDVRWRYPDGARRPEIAPVRGGRGVIAMQLVGGNFRWLEYS